MGCGEFRTRRRSTGLKEERRSLRCWVYDVSRLEVEVLAVMFDRADLVGVNV